MNLAGLVEGTPITRCPCLTDDTVHYHAERLLVMSLVYAQLWRTRILRDLGTPAVTWTAPGGDDHEWSRPT